MMEPFASLVEFSDSIYRNVPAPRPALDRFGDLLDPEDDDSGAEAAAALADSFPGSIDMNPEEHHYRAVGFPFESQNFAPTRFSDGFFPVFYASLDAETTIYETAYHWVVDNAELFRATKEFPIAHRYIYLVPLQAFLVNFSDRAQEMPWLVDDNYFRCRQLARRLQKGGQPGLLSPSARRPGGINAAVFNLDVVGQPAFDSKLSYAFRSQQKTLAITPPDVLSTSEDAINVSTWLRSS